MPLFVFGDRRSYELSSSTSGKESGNIMGLRRKPAKVFIKETAEVEEKTQVKRANTKCVPAFGFYVYCERCAKSSHTVALPVHYITPLPSFCALVPALYMLLTKWCEKCIKCSFVKKA